MLIFWQVYPRDIYAFGLIAWTGNDVLNRRYDRFRFKLIIIDIVRKIILSTEEKRDRNMDANATSIQFSSMMSR